MSFASYLSMYYNYKTYWTRISMKFEMRTLFRLDHIVSCGDKHLRLYLITRSQIMIKTYVRKEKKNHCTLCLCREMKQKINQSIKENFNVWCHSRSCLWNLLLNNFFFGLNGNLNKLILIKEMVNILHMYVITLNCMKHSSPSTVVSVNRCHFI